MCEDALANHSIPELIPVIHRGRIAVAIAVLLGLVNIAIFIDV